MTRLFIRFYVGVLIVLFLAWLIHGAVSERRANADLARVVTEAHGGGARLVARELDDAAEHRDEILVGLREQFEYEITIQSTSALPRDVQRQIAVAGQVAFLREGAGPVAVVVALSNRREAVRLGPFPDYDLKEIEVSIGGWVRLTANKLSAAAPAQRSTILRDLQTRFDFPVKLIRKEELPEWPRTRTRNGEDVVFYPDGDEQWFAATPLTDQTTLVRFGPFPSFENIEQKSATTTVALVLLPAALAIALLLRPVAQQLRRVEHAAKVIAAGDLSARVDERRMNSAKPLAQAFNLMAGRTETLVRTQRELLQAVSHELRTPLSRMRFAIDLIETASDDTERKQRLDALDAAAEELDELVGELLSYVRMETSVTQLTPEPIALSGVLEVLLPKHAAVCPQVRFDVGKLMDDDITVFADRAALQRVLGNLLSNAGRFAESCVTIQGEMIETGTVIDVDDDGAGIATSERERVFEPFVRLDSNTNGHGVGLGLALVKRIVSQHGGSVEVLSSPTGGCRIRTVWPTGDTAVDP